ncbi:hypothetical protein [Nocardioides sp. SYSU DS0663]|uniref:hypothetical protein n=1 Tax=Nocardioides sp. SYSU DS0663 TaxID=3416445 RepID=UPI003F4C3C07
MTLLRHDTTRRDHRGLAAAARSILACPRSVTLAVDGVPHALEGPEAETTGLQDRSGEPVFSCAPGARLAGAAADGGRGLVEVTSGLGRAGSPDREAVLTLAGPLVVRGREECECCGEPCEVVALVPEVVTLSRIGDDAHLRVPVRDFLSPEHQLNRGFLQRSVEHANHHHQAELRLGVATMTGTRVADVLGVALADLRPSGVELQWVTPEGAERAVLGFPRAARTTAELGDMLRRQLHA